MMVLSRRWAALRSCIREYQERQAAAVQLQCLVRTSNARKLFRHRSMSQRSRMRDLNQTDASTKVMSVQSRIRARSAATTLLANHYDQRLEWCADSPRPPDSRVRACVRARRHLCRRYPTPPAAASSAGTWILAQP